MTTSTFTSLMVKENYASMLESLKRFGLPLFEYYYFASHSNEKAWEFHLDNTRLLMTIYKFFFTYGEGKLYKYIRWSQNMMTMTFFNFCFLFHWEAWEFYIYFKSNLQHVSLNIWKKEPYKFSTKDSSCYMHLHYSIIMDLYNTSDPVL